MIYVPVIKAFDLPILGFKFTIFTYFLCSFLGYLVGMSFIFYNVKKKKLSIADTVYAFLAAFAGIIIGSRFFFYFMPWWSYDRSWTIGERIMRFVNVFGYPGMVMYGGLFGCVLALWIYFKWKKLSFWKYADAYAPGMFIGYAIGRVGCFLVDDTCRGGPTNLPWGVVRHIGEGPIHPAPLYSTLVALIIFIVLWSIRNKEHFDGWLALIGLMAYSSTRFMIEFVRVYSWRLFGIFSPSHLISIALFAFALWLFLKKSKEARSKATIRS